MSGKLDEISAASGNGNCSKLQGDGAWGLSYINSSDVPTGDEDISISLGDAFAFYGAAGAYCAAGELSIANNQIAKGNAAVAQAEETLRDDGGQVTPPPGAPTSASAPASQPAASYPTPAPEYIGPPGCPGSAQLMAAWNAAPASAFQSQGVGKRLSISGFNDISCWRGWIVANVIANANGLAVFSQQNGLHMLPAMQLQQFNSAVCSSPDSPAAWKNPADGPATCSYLEAGGAIVDPAGQNLRSTWHPVTAEIAGDGTYYIAHTTWPVWNSTTAVADGTAEIASCQPSCADGHRYSAPVVATFTDPVQICGWYFWSRVLLHYPGAVPVDEQQDRLWVFEPSASYYTCPH